MTAPLTAKLKPRNYFRKFVFLCFQVALFALLKSVFFVDASIDGTVSLGGDVHDSAPGRTTASVPAGASSGVWGSVYSSDGVPIPLASVCISPWNVRTSIPPVRCLVGEHDGSFRFSGVSPGGYIVTASMKDFAAASANQGMPVFLAEGATLRADIVLQHEGVKLSGVVRDGVGGTVAGAAVRAAVFEPALRLETRSGEDGEFTFWVPRGAVGLSASAPGYSDAEAIGVRAPSSEVELVLMPAGRIVGRVVSARDGQPVPELIISAAPLGAPYHEGSNVAESDETGEFSLDNLAPGSYVLRARDAHWQGSYPEPVEVELGSTNRGVLITVSPAVRVSGRVIFDSSGEPCRTGTLMFGPWPDPTVPQEEAAQATAPATAIPTVDAQTVAIGADGTVVFDGVSPGLYHAVVRCADAFLSAGPRTILVAREEQVNLTWKVSSGLRVTVETLDDLGAEVSDATVTLKFDTPGAPGRKMLSVGVTNQQGRFTFNGLLPGTYEVQANGMNPDDTVAVELRSGASEKEVKLRLPGSGYIVASVRADRGNPVDGLDVKATLEESSRAPDGRGGQQSAAEVLGRARPLGGGDYRMGPLLPGLYTVVVQDGVNEPVKKVGVRASSRATVELAVAVSRSGSIEGRVVDADGAPVENAWVSATAEDGLAENPFAAPSRVLSDLDGHFALQRLAERGTYVVRAEKSGSTSGIKRSIRCGQVVDVVVPAPAELRGAVLDAKGQPVSTASVRVRHDETGAVRSQRVDQNGTFVLRGLTPGSVQLVAVTPTGHHAMLSLDLKSRANSDALRVVLTEPGQGNTEPAALDARPTGP